MLPNMVSFLHGKSFNGLGGAVIAQLTPVSDLPMTCFIHCWLQPVKKI